MPRSPSAWASPLFLSVPLTLPAGATIIAATGHAAGPTKRIGNMPATIPLELTGIVTGPYPAVVLAAIALWGLANCFLGYPLFRVMLAVHGASAGWTAGIALAQWLRSEPSSVDYLVAAGALAVLLGMAAWFACRAAFAAGVFWLVMATVVQMSPEPGALMWLLGVVIGVVAGAVVYRQLRSAVFLVTGAAGAAAAVLAGALLCTGGYGWPDLVQTIFGRQQVWLAWFLTILMVALAASGIIAQVKLSELVSDIFMPRQPGRPRTLRRRGTRVHPKFTKL